MISKPIVSVVMITYGHENYIRQAIESVLMQKCNFEIELILSNDCSPDKTNDVIQEILKTHKSANWIKYFNHKKNLGMMPNFQFALEKCTGKYIAICEGDDYWIDELKLQKQVDFLDENLDYVIHSGVATVIKENKLTDDFIGMSLSEKTFILENFYNQNNIVTCTVLFRNIIKNYPENFNTVTFGDWYFYVALLNQTKLKAFRSRDILSVYRIHENGVMKSLSQIKNKQKHIEQILKIKKFLGYKSYSDLTKTSLNNYYLSKFKLELKELKFFNSIRTFYNNLVEIKDIKLISVYFRVLLSGLKNKTRI